MEGENKMAQDSVARALALSALNNAGSSDYTDLSNKPSIENITLSGNKSASDLGLATQSWVTAQVIGAIEGSY